MNWTMINSHCPSVRIRTWFPLVRIVLELVIGWQLISDCISATRMLRGATHFLSSFSTTQVWGSPCVKFLSLYTDKNMIPTCAQSSVACDWLTINFWLYFSYTMFHGSTRTMPLQIFHHSSMGRCSPCEKGLSQCTDNNMIPTCAQSCAAYDCLTINFWWYFSYTMVRGDRQCLSNCFRHSSMGSPCDKGLSQCTDKNMIPTCAQSSVTCAWLTINFWLYFSYTMFRGAMQCLPIFSATQVWVANAKMVCPSVRLTTWFPLVRRVLAPVIGSQLLSDCISGTRRTVVLCKSPPVISWLKDAVAHATNIGLSQCTDKNMIPICAQSSAACDWLTTNFWLYFSYTMFRGATQCLSNFFRHSSIG